MNSLGLYTGLDMRNQSLEFMQANFGKAGAYYYWISRGVDNREVRANRIRKSVGAENTFSSDLTEFDAMAAELQPLIDKVWRHCEDKGSRGRTVTLKVKFADFELITRSRTVAGVDRQPQRIGVRVGRTFEDAISNGEGRQAARSIDFWLCECTSGYFLTNLAFLEEAVWHRCRLHGQKLLRHTVDREDAKMAIPFADGAGGDVFRRMSPLQHLIDRFPLDKNDASLRRISVDRDPAAAAEITSPVRLEALTRQRREFLREPGGVDHRVVFDHIDGRLRLRMESVNAEGTDTDSRCQRRGDREQVFHYRFPSSHFGFAPSMMGVVWTSFSDLTIFSVVALYFLKCSDARCDL